MIKIIPNASLALGIIFYKERKDMAGNKIRSMHILKKETFVAYLFVAPALILFLLFVGYPLVASFYLMFCDYNLITSPQFVGLKNILKFLGDKEVPLVMMSSLKLLLVLVPAHVILGLALACLVHRTGKKMSTAYRIILYIPTIMTTVSVATAWSYLYDTDFGVINYFLEKLGIDKIPWLNSSVWAFWAIVIFSIWKFVGTPFLYYYIGLQNIPTSLYEAAEIDGANRRQTFFHIVLPLIAPTGGIIAILCAINSLKVFDIVKTMTEGGPYYATDVIATYVYRTAFSSEIGMPRLGYASAAALFFGGAVIIIGILLNAMKDRLQKNVQ